MDTQGNGSILFEETLYRADEENCLLVAHISENSFAWNLEIEGKVNDEGYEFFSMFLYFTDTTLADWRDLANRTYVIRADDKSLFPMLPDNPSGAYTGIHYSVNNHRVHFGDRDGSKFSLSWECEARLGEGDNRRQQIGFIGSVRFDGLLVRFDRESRKILDSLPPDCSDNDLKAAYEKWQPDLRKAGLLVAQHFKSLEFDEPLKWRAALRYHLRK